MCADHLVEFSVSLSQLGNQLLQLLMLLLYRLILKIHETVLHITIVIICKMTYLSLTVSLITFQQLLANPAKPKNWLL